MFNMKKVIFICLLSLLACMGEQSQTKESTELPITSTIATGSLPTDPKDGKTQNESALIVPTQNPSNMVPGENPKAQNLSGTENATQIVSTINKTEIVPNNQTVKNQTNDNISGKKESEPKPINGTNDVPKNETKSANTTAKPDNNNSTMGDDKAKKETSTTKPEIMKTTEAPVLQARGFDGPSFIGGIILTLGLIAISFMGYKYYKNQTERNYYGTL